MLLSHRVLSSFETVEHQLTEVRVPDLARDLEVSLLLAVAEEQVSRSLIGTQVHVLALLDEPLGAEDERATVAPGLQPVWGEPVAAEVPRGTGVRDQVGVADVVESRVLGVGVVRDLAVD